MFYRISRPLPGNECNGQNPPNADVMFVLFRHLHVLKESTRPLCHRITLQMQKHIYQYKYFIAKQQDLLEKENNCVRKK